MFARVDEQRQSVVLTDEGDLPLQYAWRFNLELGDSLTDEVRLVLAQVDAIHRFRRLGSAGQWPRAVEAKSKLLARLKRPG